MVLKINYDYVRKVGKEILLSLVSTPYIIPERLPCRDFMRELSPDELESFRKELKKISGSSNPEFKKIRQRKAMKRRGYVHWLFHEYKDHEILKEKLDEYHRNEILDFIERYPQWKGVLIE